MTRDSAVAGGAPARASARRSWRRAAVTHAFSAAGLVLCAVLVWRIGLDAIRGVLGTVGWALPLIIVPHVLVAGFEALGWWLAFPRRGCPLKFAELVRFSVAAKAIQFVTPSISQAGELVKIHLLRLAGVGADVSAASVVAAKTTITIAELVFICIGFLVAPRYAAIDPLLRTSVQLGILAMGLVLAGALTWQRLGLFRPLRWVSRHVGSLATVLHRHEGFMSSTDRMLREYLVEKRRVAGSCLAYFLAWIGGAVEAWVFLWILGLPHDFLFALVLHAWLDTVNRLTAFVPANLGTHEAGAVMLFSFMGLPPGGAMAFALLRRLRQVFWILVGLGVLARVPRAQRARLAG
jgi:glycosyltransferase 2 family protein